MEEFAVEFASLTAETLEVWFAVLLLAACAVPLAGVLVSEILLALFKGD